MDFIRKIINSDELASVLNLPPELKHQQVEVLVLPLEENDTSSLDPEEFRGALNMDDTEKEIKAMRSEWERV